MQKYCQTLGPSSRPLGGGERNGVVRSSTGVPVVLRIVLTERTERRRRVLAAKS